MSKSSHSHLVSIHLPKEEPKKTSKRDIAKEEASAKQLAKLQKIAKKEKLFKGMTKDEIMQKLHETRAKLIKENPGDYIW